MAATYHPDGFYYDYFAPLTTEQMETNARYIINYFRGKGWSDNAIAAMLGNFQAESSINPGRWENNTDYRAQGVTRKGYGLAQWTPWPKYTRWCEDFGHPEWHMATACHRVWTEFENVGELKTNSDVYGGGQYYSTDEWDISRSAFIHSTLDAGTLAKVFVRNYERPGSVLYDSDEETWEEHLASKAATYKRRAQYAERWYTFVTGTEGGGSVTPPPSGDATIEVYQYMYCIVTAGEYVNIRSGPGTSNAVIGKLHRGDSVFVQTITGSWAKITDPVEGYVMVDFLQAAKPGEDSPELPGIIVTASNSSFIMKYLTMYKRRRYRVVR